MSSFILRRDPVGTHRADGPHTQRSMAEKMAMKSPRTGLVRGLFAFSAGNFCFIYFAVDNGKKTMYNENKIKHNGRML